MFILMSLSYGSPNLQLSSAAFYLFGSVHNPGPGRFSCRSKVSYHIFVYYFITRTRAKRLDKRKPPSRSRQVLREVVYIVCVSHRTRRPIGMTLVPTPSRSGSFTAVASSAARMYYC